MQRRFPLLAALVVWGIIQFLNGARLHTQSKSCISGIQEQPGIQMEFARNASQVTCLLGEPRMEPGDMNRQIMREQQYLDFVYIPLYWAFFYFAIAGAFSGSGPGHGLAKALRVVISIAAVADYLEDAAIFNALDPTYRGVLWPFPFGFTKWLFFFLALACAGGILIRYGKRGSFYMPPSRLNSVAGWLSGLSFLGSALVGLAATIATSMDRGFLFAPALLLTAVGIFVLLFWFWLKERTERS